MKPFSLPLFSEGMQYRQLHPTKEGARRWRFITTRPICVEIPGITEHAICYHDRRGKTWARHDRWGLHIQEGYAWNGCTPKRWVWPFGWMGTPDFESTRLASLCHDVAYQFSATRHFPLNRSDVDATFYHMIAMKGDEQLASIYHAAVRKFGSWKPEPLDGEFSTLL